MSGVASPRTGARSADLEVPPVQSRTRRWLIDHRLVLVVGLAAALPVIVSTVRALLDGWNPLFDDSIIAVRSFDVFSAHSPLVGEHSDASLASIGPVYSLGPLLNWLLSIPSHLFGNWAIPLTMGIVNTLAIVGIVVLARRRGGTGLMVLTALALPVMCHSWTQEVLHSPDNSKAALVLFALLPFLAWSIACGDLFLLPFTAFVFSLAVQAHLSLAVPSAGVVLVALVAAAGSAWATRATPATGSRRRWLLGSVAVLAVCWIAPLLDLALHPPGNLIRVVRTTTFAGPTLGLRSGVHALAHTIGFPPWWLEGPSNAYSAIVGPSGVRGITSVAVLIALVLVGEVSRRRRRLDLVAGVAIALVLSLSVVLYIRSTPFRLIIPTSIYGLRWASAAGMFVWLVLAWSLIVLLEPVRRVQRAIGGLRRAGLTPSRAVAGGALATAALATAMCLGEGGDYFAFLYRPALSLRAQVLPRLPRHATVLVGFTTFFSSAVQEGLVYQLRRAGLHPLVPIQFDDPTKWGPSYSGTRRHDLTIVVSDNDVSPPAGARQIASAALHGAPPEIGWLTKHPPTRMIVSLLRS